MYAYSPMIRPTGMPLCHILTRKKVKFKYNEQGLYIYNHDNGYL